MSLKTFNPQQLEAITTNKRRVLVLAGAGSGKTSVLIHRIVHLIENCGVSPNSILALTFTNKAAGEMQQRIKCSLPDIKSGLVLSTFHSFCYQLLRHKAHHIGYTRNFSLYTDKEVRRVMEGLLEEEFRLKKGALPSTEETWMCLESFHHNPALLEENQNTWFSKFSKKLYTNLGNSLQAHNALDFNMLLSMTWKLFEQEPLVLKELQDRFSYILIDEYQDTNHVQDMITHKLAGDKNNLFVVGDDDQSIYSWRGARVKNMLSFPYDHRIQLEQNYRSCPEILSLSNTLIAHNNNRHKKKLWSAFSQKAHIEMFHAPSSAQEADGILRRIDRLHRYHGVPYHEIAILFRSHIIAKELETQLMKHALYHDKIPYEVIGGTEIFERKEIKDLFAYMRFIANPQDDQALLRIINLPSRNISSKSLATITQYARQNELTTWQACLKYQKEKVFSLSPQGDKGINHLIELVNEVHVWHDELPLYVVMEKLLERIKWKEWIEKTIKSPKGQAFIIGLQNDILLALKEYCSESPSPTLQEFSSKYMLEKPTRQDSNKDCIKLITFHAAKGLEFDSCFLMGLEEAVLPHEKSLPHGEEEERRLFYVALTRAKTKLFLSMARNRLKMGKEASTKPSPFLYQLPSDGFEKAHWDKPLI